MIQAHSRTFRAVAVAALAAALLTVGCDRLRSSRDVRATILDENGAPLPGAVFYAEVCDDEGSFAFLAARAGDAGEVPDSAREPLKIAWRSGARIALAAFVPGRRPVVLRSGGERFETDGVVLAFSTVAAFSERWEPELADLAYPFESTPSLAEAISGPEHAFLREAFQEAYASLAERRANERSARETAKLQAIHGRP